LAYLYILLTEMNRSKKGKTTVIPPGEGNVNIYNGFDCRVFVRSESLHADHIGPMNMIHVRYENVSRGERVVGIKLQFDPECTLVPNNFELNTTVSIVEGQVLCSITNINRTRVRIIFTYAHIFGGQ